eukprot:CAMPEP_0198141260 /NCGR_PEP_ID=MMETSP1443-20131203/4295_1 /TAXON_ID=186043 /ORGANISM="Entomoneis sp., Strain CCMP2396" /LENGTH=224 /DNA_ID=CAMNT_0043803957 /DNA_START=111 /DNA_END=782 /DNA_ORIENTATION=+
MKLTLTWFVFFPFAVHAFGVKLDSSSSYSYLVSASARRSRNSNNKSTSPPSSSSSLQGGNQNNNTAGADPTTNTAIIDDIRGGGANRSFNAILGCWDEYNKALDAKPLLTKSLTSLVGWALGDLLAQLFLSRGPFDLKRLLVLSTFGFIYYGPSGHYFYNFLDSRITGKTGGVVFLKIAIDQLLWSPLFLVVFFSYLGCTNGNSWSVIGETIRRDLFSACKASW